MSQGFACKTCAALVQRGEKREKELCSKFAGAACSVATFLLRGRARVARGNLRCGRGCCAGRTFRRGVAGKLLVSGGASAAVVSAVIGMPGARVERG